MLQSIYADRLKTPAESQLTTGLHLMTNVPSKHDLLEIEEGLQVVKTGTVRSRNG